MTDWVRQIQRQRDRQKGGQTDRQGFKEKSGIMIDKCKKTEAGNRGVRKTETKEVKKGQQPHTRTDVIRLHTFFF